MRHRKLPLQSLAMVKAYKIEKRAAAEERIKKYGCRTKEEEMQEGVKKVATELVDLRRCVEIDVADLRYKLGTQVEELKTEHLEMHTQLLQELKVELAELRSLVKPE
eukprot:jgi/Botrbrau1/23335/Bobra.0484s0001.1